ncbi:rhodanese-like domain-containing protein [Legionella micdadei]|uniref:Rhodanese domain-containing protein n=1 Tax=Legionella micdadei TaxID=451 RepID=A0A098GK03_LEGMI|nr:rhodanese-like domain-containing protein [Legionella micdadei]ARG96776.1 sulfurtransferase [Legionella micdadei]KTD26446.1 Rhodanese domain protein [Legionella micdadei]NSL17962.1 rhodanese-like domain-containing protein [Legionella micdadei]CEG61836.1 Rhodanese domain-containing protein [Legionella micdadei]SCY25071.1 Rhodanese-related sulfurtransferase [Legionella micdadei]
MRDPKISTIDVHELKKRRDANPDLCLIDVRELDEWQTLRIPGALHIPKDELPGCIETAVPERNTPIYLHCKGGVRSLYAANCLLTMGYNEVYSIDGGIVQWAASGYPIEK